MTKSVFARLGLTTASGPGRGRGAGNRGAGNRGAGRRGPRGIGAATALLVVAGGGFLGAQAVSGINTAAEDQALITLHGHGHGHGRGMGQWGALGYAQQGWSAEQILGHYYGDTELGTLEPTEITVRLQFRDGKPLEVRSAGPLTVAGQRVGPGQSARLTPTPGGARVQIAESCGGPAVWEGETTDPWVASEDTSAIGLCDDDATFRGALGVALDGGEARTISRLDIEDYLRGVVPAESPAHWADKGGAEALKAQAVAARSYAAAESRAGYAQTCDTQDCQVYRGADLDDPRTDAAIEATRGVVLTRGGVVVPAEFSASTGGFTAGGEFPAVPDDGDALSPTHDWTHRLPAREISDAFEVGELISMTVVEANGLGVDGHDANGQGRDGGRVLRLRVEGADRTVEVSGDEARRKLSLRSDWFHIEGQEPEGQTAEPQTAEPLDVEAAPDEEAFPHQE